jgi:hypothetical protein
MNKIEDTKKAYLDVNVILTFDTETHRQVFFDLRIPISKKEINAATFLNNKLFKRIIKKCDLFGRRVEDLMKISTASNWGLFEKTTKKPSLSRLGHNCKWYFNDEINELDDWEKALKAEYGFGINL